MFRLKHKAEQLKMLRQDKEYAKRLENDALRALNGGYNEQDMVHLVVVHADGSRVLVKA